MTGKCPEHLEVSLACISFGPPVLPDGYFPKESGCRKVILDDPNQPFRRERLVRVIDLGRLLSIDFLDRHGPVRSGIDRYVPKKGRGPRLLQGPGHFRVPESGQGPEGDGVRGLFLERTGRSQNGLVHGDRGSLSRAGAPNR